MEEFELEPGEKITLSVRRHWFFLIAQLIPYVILAILPLLFIVAFPYLKPYIVHANAAGMVLFNQDLAQATPWLRLTLAFWWLFLWISAFSIYTKYSLTLWIITTTRIVDIRQFGFFSRKVSSFLLNRVQDVTTDVEGILPTMFGYGTLNVETAGREEKFQMNNISHPVELRDLIMREIAALHADGQMPQTGV
jgi:membrane protein YdbS with pleckstrin-like domain